MPIVVRTGSTDAVPVNPAEWRGWIATEVNYELNNIAASFSIDMTNIGRCEQFANEPFPLYPQTPVRVYAVDNQGENPQLLLTGFVDTDNPIEDPTQAIVAITGRSVGGDLVDCHHVRDGLDGWLWRNATALEIAVDVVSRFGGGFGIPIGSDVPMEAIDEYRATIGDTAFEILDILARREGAVLHALPDGSIRFQRASRERVGFTIHCPRDTETVHDFTRRYSEYHARGQRHGYDDADPNAAADVRAFITDDLVGRYRPRLVQPEGSVDEADALRRIQWQRARDRGDSLRMELSVPCFTDPSGALWRTNTRVWVNRPYHNVNRELLIAGVSFRSDNDEGDVTRLLLKPVEAYETEPRTRSRLSKSRASKPKTSVTASPVAAADAADYSGFDL